MPEKVSVVIPNYNDRDNLELCLESLRHQDHPDIEVIVVDDGSKDGSADMVREKFPWVRLIARDVNSGFSSVVNVGIDAAEAGLVALLNSDAEAHPRWISELVLAAERHPGAGFFATKMLFNADRDTIDTFGDGFSVGGFGYKIGWGEPSSAYPDEVEVLGGCGGAVMYRRAMLDAVREDGEYFDTDYFAFVEDVDISLRARLRGFRCIAVPGAIVYHKLRAAWGRKSERAAYLGHRNFVLAVMKNFPPSVITRNILSMLGYAVLSVAADLVKNRRVLYLKSYMGAIGMWPKMRPKRERAMREMSITAAEFQDLLTPGWLGLWLKLGRNTRSISERGL